MADQLVDWQADQLVRLKVYDWAASMAALSVELWVEQKEMCQVQKTVEQLAALMVYLSVVERVERLAVGQAVLTV